MTKAIVYIVISIMLKRWYEKEKTKLIPAQIEQNVQYGGGIRVNLKPMVEADSSRV